MSPAPDAAGLRIEEDVKIPMRDGVVLLADRWIPEGGEESAPIALVRGPYARRGPMAEQMARPLVEGGYQVVFQSARGTFGSEGEFQPSRNERLDGIDTMDWLARQSWCASGIVLVGSSYQGYTQFAMADQAPPEVKAMIVAVGDSTLGLSFLRKSAFGLESVLGWAMLIEAPEAYMPGGVFPAEAPPALTRGVNTLPLSESDLAAIGRRSAIVQDSLVNDETSQYWAAADHSGRVSAITVPASMIGGWFDVFLPGLLRDYASLVAAGNQPRLTIGPWSHAEMDPIVTMLGEALGFGMERARGIEPSEQLPVRLHIMGTEQWREFQQWPPSGYQPIPYYLREDGQLSHTTGRIPGADEYRYDPADPTPAVGGARMLPGVPAGRVDNASLEARDDVLVYTTLPMSVDMEIIGEVRAEIWFQSSLEHADVFVRLCDVDPQGQSTNITDGFVGLSNAREKGKVNVALTPTAYCLRKGHRIRLQVSSGAFPQYNRNLGTGEPRASAVDMRIGNQTVLRGPECPSAIYLPVLRRT